MMLSRGPCSPVPLEPPTQPREEDETVCHGCDNSKMKMYVCEIYLGVLWGPKAVGGTVKEARLDRRRLRL